MKPLSPNRGILKLRQSKPFWFLASGLVLSVVVSLYLLELLHDEERRRIVDRTFILTILGDGEFYVNRDKISLDDLAPRVRKFRENEGPGQMIYISPGFEVKQSTVIAAIAVIQETGHDRIGLPTETTKGGLRTGSIETAILVSAVRCDQSQQHRVPVVLVDEATATDHKVRLNGRQIELEDLRFEVRAAFNRIGQTIIYVQAVKDVTYGATTTIMDAIRRAGAREIAFELECGDSNINR